jgi:hypothetical protein
MAEESTQQVDQERKATETFYPDDEYEETAKTETTRQLVGNSGGAAHSLWSVGTPAASPAVAIVAGVNA